MPIVRNDALITTAFSISSFFDILAKFVTPYLWKKIGFFNIYVLGFSSYLIVMLLTLIFGLNFASIMILVILLA